MFASLTKGWIFHTYKNPNNIQMKSDRTQFFEKGSSINEYSHTPSFDSKKYLNWTKLSHGSDLTELLNLDDSWLNQPV